MLAPVKAPAPCRAGGIEELSQIKNFLIFSSKNRLKFNVTYYMTLACNYINNKIMQNEECVFCDFL